MKIGTDNHYDVLKICLTDPSKKVTFLMTSALFQVEYLFHKNRSYYIPLERYFDAESEKGLSHGLSQIKVNTLILRCGNKK